MPFWGQYTVCSRWPAGANEKAKRAKRRALRMAEPCLKDRFNNSEKHDSLRDKYRKEYNHFPGS